MSREYFNGNKKKRKKERAGGGGGGARIVARSNTFGRNG